jgi:uncharacterized membrane protein
MTPLTPRPVPRPPRAPARQPSRPTSHAARQQVRNRVHALSHCGLAPKAVAAALLAEGWIRPVVAVERDLITYACRACMQTPGHRAGSGMEK